MLAELPADTCVSKRGLRYGAPQPIPGSCETHLGRYVISLQQNSPDAGT